MGSRLVSRVRSPHGSSSCIFFVDPDYLGFVWLLALPCQCAVPFPSGTNRRARNQDTFVIMCHLLHQGPCQGSGDGTISCLEPFLLYLQFLASQLSSTCANFRSISLPRTSAFWLHHIPPSKFSLPHTLPIPSLTGLPNLPWLLRGSRPGSYHPG